MRKPKLPSKVVLTARHCMALHLLAQGRSTARVASALGYTPGSGRVFLHKLYARIGVTNRAHAMLWWLKNSSHVVPNTKKGVRQW